MASATETALNTQSSAIEPTDIHALDLPTSGRSRDGQVGLRGVQQNASREARRNGRGRGNQANRGRIQRQRRISTVENWPAPPIPPPPGPGGGGSFGGRLIKDAETNEGEDMAKEQNDQEDDVEAEVCFICASTVVHNSVAPCNHRTCHICALRLRALYKTRACAHCRVSRFHSFNRSISLIARVD